MKKMITLYAEDGKVLTNGTDYGTVISLGVNISDEGYYEITIEEYEKLFEKANEIVDSEV